MDHSLHQATEVPEIFIVTSSLIDNNLNIQALFTPQIHILSFVLLSVLRQALSLFQSQFSTECDLVLPLSISSILSLPEGHSVTAYVFFPVFSSLLISIMM
jgi:hypothetical protein